MKFNKRNALILGIGVIISSIVSAIVISWGSFMLKGYYKVPVNPNASSILAGVTGMWGSIFGGAVGGFLTLAGVLLTIERERNNTRRRNYQSQLGAAIFLSIVVDNLSRNILAAKEAIKNILEKGLPYKVTSRDDLYKTFAFQFIDRSHDWAPYIEKIQDVNLQKDLWITYKNFISIHENVYRDTSDLHNEKQEILCELPEDFLEKPPEVLTSRQKFLLNRFNILDSKITMYEILRRNEWMNFEHVDQMGQVESIKLKLNKLIDDIHGTFERA